MTEVDQWNSLRPRLRALDPVRVENSAHAGTPDVNYLCGWIELKQTGCWPIRPDLPVHIQSLWGRPQQVAFLTRRWNAGGWCWIALRVGRQDLFIPGIEAREVRLGATRARLLDLATWSTCEDGRARKGEGWASLILMLQGGYPEAPHQKAKLMRGRMSLTREQMSRDFGATEDDIRIAENGGNPQMASDLIEYFTC